MELLFRPEPFSVFDFLDKGLFEAIPVFVEIGFARHPVIGFGFGVHGGQVFTDFFPVRPCFSDGFCGNADRIVGIGREPVGVYAEFFPIRLDETGGFRPGLVGNKRGRYKKTFRIRVFQHQVVV